MDFKSIDPLHSLVTQILLSGIKDRKYINATMSVFCKMIKLTKVPSIFGRWIAKSYFRHMPSVTNPFRLISKLLILVLWYVCLCVLRCTYICILSYYSVRVVVHAGLTHDIHVFCSPALCKPLWCCHTIVNHRVEANCQQEPCFKRKKI